MKNSKLANLKKKANNNIHGMSFKKKKGENIEKGIEEEAISGNEQIEYEDEFEDEWEDEEVIDRNDSNEHEKEEEEWQEEEQDFSKPFLGTRQDIKEGEELACSPGAYRLLTQWTAEWPCLSFDFIVPAKNNEDISKVREFEHSSEFDSDIFMVAGSQANNPSNNSLYILKLSELEEEETNSENSFDQGGSEPDIYCQKIPLMSSTNRIRAMSNYPIVALLNEHAQLQLYDLRTSLATLQNQKGNSQKEKTSTLALMQQFTLQDEGFALEFSKLVPGRLACGIRNGSVLVYEPTNESFGGLTPLGQPIKTTNASIEDIKFSPNQTEVLATGASDGVVRIYDLRAPINISNELKINSHNCDINVLAWNIKSPTLLATGADDGSFKVWDLRFIGKESISHVAWHKDQITSLEWQPHDQWTLLVGAGDDRVSIWDLSVEKDNNEIKDPTLEDIPDQLLFLHQGQEGLKEVRWHPSSINTIGSTALDGFNLFRPSLDEEEEETTSPNDLALIPEPI